ncbi:MAG TPA: TIGR03086 family metal-binding protein [Acidimicrobiales bacterium]|nr:TIGR03086 family metal-binding protein [Acidimicrobiales bacterium]
MDDLELLERVLDKTGDLVAGVTPDQYDRPTPCPDYDVRALVNHITGWVQSFAAGANGNTFDSDPNAYEAGDDPSAEFRAAASEVLSGWRTHGTDRQVGLAGGDLPGQMVLNMTIMEYLTHGWDLATATRQSVPYTEDEATAALERAQGTLPPQYRGADQPFGDIVEVPDTAPAVDRFIGFMGRDPGSAA